MTFSVMTHWLFLMKRFPRLINLKVSSIKFLINNSKSVNLTVCQGLRDLYNWCSLFSLFLTRGDLHRPWFGTRDHHLPEWKHCSRLSPCEVQSGMHLPISIVFFPSSRGCRAPVYLQRKGQGFAGMRSVLVSVITPNLLLLRNELFSSFALLHSTDCILHLDLQFGAVSSRDF